MGFSFYHMEDTVTLRKRFAKLIMDKWKHNTHNLPESSCVYALISFTPFTNNWNFDVVYIGSTVRLFSRYKSHKIPYKIQENGDVSLLYYKPMDKGFYDYEIKLIKKLQPKFNKQHK